MRYKKVTEGDVIKILISIEVSVTNPMRSINIINIARLLKTSRYQVKKHMDKLKGKGLVKLTCETLLLEERGLPYWGYSLTSKAKETEQYKAAVKREEEVLRECFGI